MAAAILIVAFRHRERYKSFTSTSIAMNLTFRLLSILTSHRSSNDSKNDFKMAPKVEHDVPIEDVYAEINGNRFLALESV
jgi:hypothetical protein